MHSSTIVIVLTKYDNYQYLLFIICL